MLLAAAMLLARLRAGAQVQMGDQLLFNLAGTVSAGYSEGFSDGAPSSHGIVAGGNANFSGSYHTPQFLSFDVAPFFNQSRNDSTYQSITDSSGVTANTSIFGGSKYPGYVNFEKFYNSEGNYSVPGIANYRTNGNGQTFGVGWSANPTDLPSLTVGYQRGSTDYSLYGTSAENHSQYQSISTSSNYSLMGFRLGGGFRYTDEGYTSPEILPGQSVQESTGSTTTYTFNVSRSLPLDGGSWVNYARNTTGYNAEGLKDSETSDVVTAGVSFKPVQKLSASLSADYDNNLAGAIYQAVQGAGGLLPASLPQESSHGWGVFGQVQYTLDNQLCLTGSVSRRQQLFLGASYDSTSYSGGASYGHKLWGGKFSESTVVMKSFLGTDDESRLGVLSNTIYTRKIGTWNVSGSFGYSREVQTFLLAYTTSGFSYSGSVNHRFGKLTWSGTAAGSKSILNDIQSTNSLSQSYTMALSTQWLGVSAGYSTTSGLGLYTAQGIVPLPSGLPPTLLPSTVLFGGSTYSVGLGGSPIRGLTFSGTYASTRSNTTNGSLSSNNRTDEGNIYLQYKFRKVFLTAGYSRLVQGFSLSSLAPAMISTYYVGLSRWFNFF